MTDSVNFKQNILEEDYFSDEELREAFINPEKHVILQKERKSFQIVQDTNLKYELESSLINEEDLRNEMLLKMYIDMTEYVRNNYLLILDNFSIKDMRYFLKKN